MTSSPLARRSPRSSDPQHASARPQQPGGPQPGDRQPAGGPQQPGRPAPDAGGILASLLLAVLLVAVVGAAAFYYFGGRADVNVKIKKSPNITVSGSPSPS